jgi:hypothetical protein
MWAAHHERVKEARGYSKWFNYLGAEKMTGNILFLVAGFNGGSSYMAFSRDTKVLYFLVE